MSAIFSVVAFLVALFSVGEIRESMDVRSIPIEKGWASNTVNTVVFRHNSVTTSGKWQFAAFYDASGHVVIARRETGNDKFETRQTEFTGNTRDAHNTICIAIDGKGYLHIAWDHHANPLRYARSKEPYSLDLTEKLPMTGKQENKVTYPEFYNLADGKLLFLYRDGASGNGNLILNTYDPQTQKWERLQDNLIDGQNQRNAYWQLAVGTDGVIHVSWVWRESGDVATNHDICYAKSTDGGKTWQKSTGEKYVIPINLSNAEIAVKIPQKHELINQTSMTTDSKGRPFIATYWREEGQDIPQYHMVYLDGKEWKVTQIGKQTIPFRLGGAGTKKSPLSRPQLLVDSSGATDKAYMIFRDQGRGNRVSFSACDDLSKGVWNTGDLVTTDVGDWEPSYDIALWQDKKIANIFVQRTEQRDGEGVGTLEPQMVYIVEWKAK